MKPWLIGESNPYGGHEEFALYPEPRGCTGERLCRLILRMDPDEYVESFERRNLLTGSKWSIVAGRAAAAKMREQIGAAKAILLGAKVSAAFGLKFEPYTMNGSFVIVPHPSGLNFAWRQPGAFERARATIFEAIGRKAA